MLPGYRVNFKFGHAFKDTVILLKGKTNCSKDGDWKGHSAIKFQQLSQLREKRDLLDDPNFNVVQIAVQDWQKLSEKDRLTKLYNITHATLENRSDDANSISKNNNLKRGYEKFNEMMKMAV